MIERRGLTLVGITVANLDDRGAGVQLALPLDGRWTAELDAAIDELRERYGSDAVTRAAPGRAGACRRRPGHTV